MALSMWIFGKVIFLIDKMNRVSSLWKLNNFSLSLVNGGWSDYGPFGSCSATCGGTKTRERKCNNPSPSCGGSGCRGNPIDRQPCGPTCCRGMSQYLSIDKVGCVCYNSHYQQDLFE